MIFVNMILAFVLAYQAGQMKAMINVDRVEGRKSHWSIYTLLVLDVLMSIYFIISVYGAGIAR